RSIGQQPITAAKNVNQTLGITLQADPADRGRDQFRPARFEAIEHDLLVRISSRADDQPGGERRARNYKRIIHNSLSWRANLCDPTERSGVLIRKTRGRTHAFVPSTCLTARKRPHDLDIVTGAQRFQRPFGAAEDGTVYGYGNEPRTRIDPAGLQQFAY